jgi:hypothetical protein
VVQEVVPRGDLAEHPADAAFALVEQGLCGHVWPIRSVVDGPRSVYYLNRCPAPFVTARRSVVLERNTFLIKERVKILSSVQTYDIFDEAGQVIGTAAETIGTLTKGLRWVMSKHLLPTRLEVREKPDDSLLFTMRRGWYLFKSRVEVIDPDGELIGYFKSKFFTISGGFHVYDKNDKQFAEVKG